MLLSTTPDICLDLFDYGSEIDYIISLIII